MVVRITQLRSISDRPKWIKAGGLTTLVNQYLATALLTVDRVTMVRIHIKYAAVITKRRACYAIAAAWMVSLLHASYYTCKTNQYQVFQTIVLAWDLTIILLLIRPKKIDPLFSVERPYIKNMCAYSLFIGNMPHIDFFTPKFTIHK